MTDDASRPMEYITVIGNSFEEVVAECRAQHLHERRFSIVQPIGRHQITMAGGQGMNGHNLVSATYARRAEG